MSRKNIVGALICAVVFTASFLTADGALYFLNGIGLLIVLAGTAGATLLSYPWSALRAALRVGWNAYSTAPPSADEVVGSLTRFSVHSRCDGILALERYEGQTTVSFLRRALEMMVDGYDGREIREVLSTEVSFFLRRRQQHIKIISIENPTFTTGL